LGYQFIRKNYILDFGLGAYRNLLIEENYNFNCENAGIGIFVTISAGYPF
jgi:hypothetical protein